MPAPCPEFSLATNIDDVLDRLESIIAWSITAASRLGYFAALYKRITRAIKIACEKGMFQDSARMALLDTAFANRYFTALNGYFHPEKYPKPSRCWQAAFDAAALPEPIIVSHMLVGVSAHIGFDLGIAAAQMKPLDSLRDDFNTINAVLTEQVKAVLDGIDELSPVLAELYDFTQKYEITTIDDGLTLFRDGAWRFASLLSHENDLLQAPTLIARDAEIADLEKLLLHPPSLLTGCISAIGRKEQADVMKNIQALDAMARRDFSAP